MKKIFLILMLVVFSASLFAQDDATMYWENEIDSDGQLITYYLLKTDEQLNNNLDFFIKTISGINRDYKMPNTNTMKKQMVSAEYIEKNYPELYQAMHFDDSDKINRLDWSDYKYYFSGFTISQDSGFFVLGKRIEEKVYFSLSVYINGGLDWSYTNQCLELWNESL